jgi:arabinofuranosyltransferase
MPDAPVDSKKPALASSKKVVRVRAIVLATLVIALIVGALQLAFLCDDAFILFRYVSNARDGHGLVWNPPPFQPVEGYTQFLWVLLLWAAWSWFGVEPPSSANALSILCGLGLFAVVAFAAFRIRNREGNRAPDVLAFVALGVVVGNRTFLQSLTSGLDTSLFNLGFVSWVLLAFRAPERRTQLWLATWAAAAAATALTRPDGMLCVAATAALGTTWSLRRNDSRYLLSLVPLLAVAAHVMWRRSFYGEWLPNTYYAKVVAPWAEAGIRYFECFCFENGGWLWLPIALVWLLLELRRGAKAAIRRHENNLPQAAAVAATLVHVGYYLLRVGGDPFEYRVLSHLIPLGALSAAAMVASKCSSARIPIACTLALGLSACVGWVHLALTERRLTLHYEPLAAKVPHWLQPLWRWHDRNQAWLHAHIICGRSHQHALFLDATLKELPERSRMAADANDLPVASFRGVGVAGWVLPDCYVIDMHGLNDWVVARTPVRTWGAPWLPKEQLEAVLARADGDHDANLTRSELEAAIVAVTGTPAENAQDLVAQLLLFFAVQDPERLTATEAEQIVPFFAGLRLMGHDRLAPAEYVAAFDPNVTVVNRKVVVRKRDVPLTAARVRAIEQEWRAKMR